MHFKENNTVECYTTQNMYTIQQNSSVNSSVNKVN